jgi:hypothetical protein
VPKAVGIIRIGSHTRWSLGRLESTNTHSQEFLKINKFLKNPMILNRYPLGITRKKKMLIVLENEMPTSAGIFVSEMPCGFLH